MQCRVTIEAGDLETRGTAGAVQDADELPETNAFGGVPDQEEIPAWNPEGLLSRDPENELNRQILSYSQRFDIQTGLLNHQAIQDALAGMLRNRTTGREVALIWIDLVNLRREFSLWGWTGAEALARRVAGTLRSVVDANSLLGRVGGRSFLVAMEASKHDKAGRQRIQAIVDALMPVRNRGSETRPEVAAGVAFFPVDTESVEDLVRFASLAAMRAGHVKSQTVIAFHAGMNSLIVRDHVLEVEMRKGLDQGQFTLAYQPKVALTTGEIRGGGAHSLEPSGVGSCYTGRIHPDCRTFRFDSSHLRPEFEGRAGADAALAQSGAEPPLNGGECLRC